MSANEVCFKHGNNKVNWIGLQEDSMGPHSNV